MRTRWWVCVPLAVVACAAVYLFTHAPARLAAVTQRSERRAVEQTPAPLAPKDQTRVAAVAADAVPPEPSPKIEKQARLENADTAAAESGELKDANENLSYLAYYAYSEIPPDPKPADTVLKALKDDPPGTPVDEIGRVSGVLGLDFTFMKSIARIESGFNPNQRTGSYIGLFQLSKHEFDVYGSGDIRDPRDNTVAAELKFMMEGMLFELYTHKKPTLDDLYLIHQQGLDGAAEHVSHPHRLAWRSMCATDEGKEKGEKWCKRAIWGNTLPALKRVWKSVNRVTSAEFVAMWQQRVAEFYAAYSQTAPQTAANR